MKDLFLDILFLSLMASTVGMFWTLCLSPNMIFDGLGDRIRYKLQRIGSYRHGRYVGWGKVMKGLQCPYCVSIWIIIIVHVLYYYLFEPTNLTVGYSIFLLFFEMGLTTLINKITSVFINEKLKL